ncbi:MAG TPA: tRNA (adenosine(37)-N6)-dimethylallyltransferase MiaA [Ktedonobacterales bacterium]|nr:tRNA (adenosine(37)-N6)-dimethylallyltransferase MiaA [Ktedonobacterales bacterium]
MTSESIPLLVVVGPTASGKTALALALAERFGGEIINADSRQIYRLMAIGTAKPSAAERARVPHHLLDLAWPDESFTLAQYQAAATAAIADVWARGRLPLLVGGTGLYVRAVVDGLAIPAVAPRPELRAELEAEARQRGPAALHARLAALDPAGAATIDAANTRRLIRALEVCLVTGRPFSEQRGARPTPYDPLPLGLNTARERLYAWADARVDAMLAAGLLDEVRTLVGRGYAWSLPALSSLGYHELGAHLRGELTLAEATARLRLATHALIRRQLTWFRPDARIRWLDAADPALAATAGALVADWLAAHSAQPD